MKTKNLLKTMALTLTLLLAGKVGWGQYSGIGTFVKITNLTDLVDGYYVIANSGEGFAMNTTNLGSYFQNTAITPVSGIITNPATTIVWKIQKDGSDYTVSNTVGTDITYVSYSGTSNAAYAVVNPSAVSDNERWSISYASNVFTFANKAISNRILQYNSSSPRFACYTSAQQKLILYKFIDNTPPSLVPASFIPADDATDVNVRPTLSLTFDEYIQKGTGYIYVRQVLDDAAVAAIDVNDANVSISGATATINLIENLGFSKDYYVQIDGGAFTDLSSNAFAGIDDKTTWNFTTRAASTDATVSSATYTVDDVAETITNVPSSETLATFEGNITPAAGATFDTYNADGTTVATDLATGYKVICTAEDGITKKTYTITLNTEPSHDATVSSATYTVDNVAETITNVPWNETLAAFESKITPAAGATFDTYNADGTTVATDLATGYKVICTAEDGTTKKTYTITLNPHIAITSPNGGETFYAGDNITITWTSANMGAETLKYEAYVRQGLSTTWSWQEQAPSIPNTGSFDFTIPADATYGNQFKIRLTGNTSGITDESDAAFTIIATPHIFNIQSENTAGASSWANDSVRIGGIVTAVTSNAKNYYLQAGTGPWSGIYVYYNTIHTYQVGDSLIVKGKVLEYNNLTELETSKAATVVSTGNTVPTPAAISTLAANAEDYESVLIKVTGATCTVSDVGNGKYTVDDGSGELVVFKSIYDPQLQLNRKYDVTGVLGWYITSSQYQLYPRSAADVYAYSNDATLQDLKVDGITVAGFNPATLTYIVELPYGTTTVPTVTYTLNDAKATAIKTDADALPGSTTVAVTAEDGLVSQTYTINFTVAAPNTEANILTFTVASVDATIDNGNHTITATVPYSTDITNLVATFTLSDGATAKVGAVAQVSGVTANDFTNPVTYTVTAQDGATTQDWVVTITKTAEPNHEAIITAYSINGVNGVISSGDHTISVTLPYGTDVTGLVATYTLSTNATAKVGATVQVSGTTANDFTNPVTYTVTAEDGTTTQDWVVTVTVTPASNAKDITSFTITGQVSSVIDAVAGTVAVVMPFGTNVTSLTPTITVSQYATINPASGVAQDFTNPVTYTVTAQDASTKVWTVTVTVAKNTETNILTYSINGVDGTIDNVNHTVAITLPYGTDVTSLVATFTLSGGASAQVGGVDQVSGVTANDFTNPVTYTVTAEDGATTQDWVVTVTVAQPPLTTLVAWTFPNNPDDNIADEGIAENASRVITCTASGTVAYNVAGVTTFAATNTGWDNGVDTKYWMVQFTTKGYKDITVSSAQKASNTGPKDFKLQYEVNSSGTWADVPGATAIVVASDNFISGKIDNISLPAECNNANLVALRWVVNSTVAVNGGTVAGTGTSRIDDIIIKGKVASLSNDATVTSTVYTVDSNAGTITNVPQSETLANFKANITPAAGATFEVYQADGTTVATDLQSGYKLICTAEDGVTSMTYTITLNITLSSEKAILSYSINGVNGTIDAVNHTVTLTLPYGTDRSNLVATFTLSAAATAKVGTTVQVSGTTANDFTNPVTYTVTAEDGSTQDWVVTVNLTAASTEKDILTFTIAGQVSSVIDAVAGTVTVVMPYGTNVTALTPTIEVSEHATIDPASGVAQDFTNPVTYTVTAQNASTKVWTVTVTVQPASNDATVSSTIYTVNNVDGTITNVPYNESIATFKLNITPAAGATFEVYQNDGTTVATDLQNGYKLICTAQDGITTKTYTIILNTPPSTPIVYEPFDYTDGTALQGQGGWVALNTGDDLLIATGNLSYPYLAPSTGNKLSFAGAGIDAYNEFSTSGISSGKVYYSFILKVTDLTAATEALGGYFIGFAYDNTSFGATVWTKRVDENSYQIGINSRTNASTTVFTSSNYSKDAEVFIVASYKVVSGTGNDEAKIWINPASQDFGAANEPASTLNITNTGGTDLTSVKRIFIRQDSDTETPAIELDELRVGYTWAQVTPKFAISNDATVTSTVYTVDSNAGTITNVPQTETLANFKANISPAAGATFEVYQADGTTVATDLQSGYKLICTAEDGVTKKTYTITLNATLSSENTILSYSINGVNGTIDAVNHTVTLTLPYGTDRSNLVATFTLSAAATAKVGTTVQVSGTTANDFTNPVTYTVTAEDGSTQDWVVTVNLTAASTEKDILSFSIPSQISSVVDAQGATVAVLMPAGTNVTSLTPTITVSVGATINPASGVAQDFTNPVTYTVTAQDASTKVWTVTVSVQQVSTLSIHSIQYTTDPSGNSPYMNQSVTTGGIVSAIKLSSTTGNQQAFYIQDAPGSWNGLYIYSATPVVAVGDSVIVTGTITEYNTLTEMSPVTSGSIVSSGNTVYPAAVATTLAANSEEFESVLIKVQNAACTSGSAGSFVVNDGSGDLTVYKAIYAGLTLEVGRKYDITGVVGWFNTSSIYQLYPRSTADVYAYSNDATLSTFTLGGQDVLALTGIVVANPATDPGATLHVADFTGFAGIVAAATSPKATFAITLNGATVDPGSYATQALANGDVVVASVTAEDGTIKYYKVTLSGENRTLTVTAPAGGESYSTGQQVTITWTSTNIANVNISVYEAISHTFLEQLNILPVDATLGTFTYTIRNGEFGTIVLRVSDAADPTFFAESAGSFTVTDNAAPVITDKFPANNATSVARSFTLSITFDEDVNAGTGSLEVKKTADNSVVLTATAAEATINNGTVTLNVSGLDYNTSYYVTLPAGFVVDQVGTNGNAAIVANEWSFTTQEEQTGDLFFSEYLEGSSNNKAVEIFNPTSGTVDLSHYTIKKGTNGADFSTLFSPKGTLAAQTTFVIANSGAVAGILNVADTIDAAGSVVFFNGDDAIGLFKDDVLIDVIGLTNGVDPGTAWPVAGVANATAEHTLIRKYSITHGNTDWNASAGTTPENSEWEVHPQDYIDNLGTHSTTLSTAAEILTFALSEQTGAATINSTNGTINIEVLYGTNVTNLVPTITVSAGATINPASGVAQNFTNPVTYTVTAQDGTTTKIWTVTVTVASTASSEKDILSFNIPSQISSVVDAQGATVAVLMPAGTNVTSLTPTITVSVGATINPASGVAQDFTNPVTYTVTAQDASIKVWTVTVTVQQVSTLSIHSIQYTTDPSGNSPYMNQSVTTGGIVSAIKLSSTTGNQQAFYIQDAPGSWNGLYIYSATPVVAVGDSVIVTGTITEYNTLTEMSPVTSGSIVSSGNTVYPAAVATTSAANSEEFESVLIKVQNAACTSGSAGSFVVNDGSGDLTVYKALYADLNLTVGTNYNITGVITWFSTGTIFELYPRNASDVEIANEVPVSPVSSLRIYPNPFTDVIRFSGSEVSRVTIFSVIGQVVLDQQVNGAELVDTHNLEKGIYLVRFTNDKGESTTRKLVKQ